MIAVGRGVLASALLGAACAAGDAGVCDDDFIAGAANFTCVQHWRQVGRLRIANACNLLDEAVAVAENSVAGQRYPLGTIIALTTSEAMVKRAAGFDSDHHDWEYFLLDATPDLGTRIRERGRREVRNAVGSCLDCHASARDYDFVCGTDHGCAPLPLSSDTLAVTQALDVRCLRR